MDERTNTTTKPITINYICKKINQMKPIPNYPNYSVTKDGEVWSLRFNKKLTPCRNSRGYMQVVLCKDLKYKNYTIHRLVAEAYIDNVNNYKMVNHINGIKTDNRIDNLE